MREQYIQLIKEYVAAKPDYKSTINEIRTDLLAIGATNEEIDQAISELGVAPAISQALSKDKIDEIPIQQTKKTRSFNKFLVEFDIVTHIIFIVIVSFFGFIFFLSPTFTQRFPQLVQIFSKPNFDNNMATFNPEAIQETLLPHVYATTKKIDANAVFSIKPSSSISLAITGNPKKEVYGFFPYWMLEQQEKVNINALKTMALFGLEANGKGEIVTKDNEGKIDGGWEMWQNKKLNDLITRARRKNIKIELTIKAFNADNIVKLTTSDAAQETFIANTIHLMNLKSLDGINLDFEYVGNITPDVRDGFTRLVTNLRTEMKKQYPKSTLTVDTYVSAASIPQLVDITAVAEQVDSIIIMGYDIHTPSGSAGPLAPMEGSVSITGFMQSYLEKVSPDKLILAVPYYGYDWVVAGDILEPKIIPYAQIMDATKNTTISWSDVSQTPYYQYKEGNSTREVHFENTRSLGIKYDYINKKELKGVGIWALGYDGLNTDLQSVIIEKFAR